jgi:hypothetical protein
MHLSVTIKERFRLQKWRLINKQKTSKTICVHTSEVTYCLVTIVPCSFNCCSKEFQFRLRSAYWFYLNHNSISKQNYSKEWRNWKYIESYGEWKYNIHIPNCIKTSKSFSSVFRDFRFPKCLTSFFSPQIFGRYVCTHQLLQEKKQTNNILCM